MPKYKTVLATKTHLTEMQEKFCEEYLKNGRHLANAARVAGYAKTTLYSTPHKLINKPHIKKYLDSRLAAVRKEYKVDFDYKIGKLAKVVKAYLPENDDLSDPEGTRVALEKVKVAISAIQELNKMQGDYAAEKRANVNINLDADMEKLKQVMDELVAKYRKEY